MEPVSPNEYHAEVLFEQSVLDLSTSKQLAEINPTRAYEALYESYRQAINGLLARALLN